MSRNSAFFLAFVFAAANTSLFSSNLPVGVASSISSYSVNSATVSGNTDLIEGSELRTSKAPSEIVLQNGAAVELAHKSAGTIYRDRMVLQNGTVHISKFDQYPVAVRSLQVDADDRDSEATIRAKGNTIEVASIGNGVSVMQGSALLSRVAAGTRMSFKQTQAAQAPSTFTASGPQLPSDTHVLYWFIGAIAGAALIIGGIAIAQGKSL